MIKIETSNPSTRAQQLRELIEQLKQILLSNNGEMHWNDLLHEVFKTTQLSKTHIPYIINSAVADEVITYDLRTGKVTLL